MTSQVEEFGLTVTTMKTTMALAKSQALKAKHYVKNFLSTVPLNTFRFCDYYFQFQIRK